MISRRFRVGRDDGREIEVSLLDEDGIGDVKQAVWVNKATGKST